MGICKVSKKIEDVIIALDEKPMRRMDIAYRLGIGGGTVKKIVDWMLENNLAEEVPVSRFNVEVRLTEKGKKLAKLVKEIQKLLEEEN
ncbi:MAG: hypothetical protein F7C36_00335 [Desulfurococcales archaeon]|nr:hypothetical protein [Desulfurococcales archaeon]